LAVDVDQLVNHENKKIKQPESYNESIDREDDR